MLGLNLSALAIYRLTGHFGTFHVLALSSLATLAAGLLPVLLRRPRRYWLEWHYFGVGMAYAGLIAAFINELLVRVPFLRPIVIANAFDQAAIGRIFRVGGILGQIATLLCIALLVWRHRSVMAKLGRAPRDAPVSPSGSVVGLGYVLFLLGGVTMIRHGVMQFWPGAAQIVSTSLGFAIIPATLMIAYRRRDEPADLRWLAAYNFLLLFATVWSSLLGHFGTRELMAFWPTIIMFGLVMLGLFLADALVVLGLTAAVLVVVGFQFAGPWFALWLGVVAGGAEIWAGWRLLPPRHQHVGVAASRFSAQVTT
jgi:hypothetical protein